MVQGKGIFEGYDPEFYDISHVDYKTDVQFYIQLAKGSRGKVLEIACGSGRVYLELLRAGADLYGIDISEKMLSALRQKARVMELKPKVQAADMRDFNLDSSFDLIIIPFRSFLHNITTDDQLKTLKCCRKHLAEHGRLALNFFYPSREVITNTYGKEIHETINTKEGQIDLIEKSYFISETDQVLEMLFIWKQGDRELSRFRSKLAMIYKREFELLLRLAGYTRWQV